MKKKKNSKIFYLLFFIASIFFGLFVLIEFHEDYLAVTGAFFILLIAAYLAIDKQMNDSESNIEMGDNEVEHQIKADYLMELLDIQKASYVAVKKNTAILEEQFTKLSEEAELIGEQIRLFEELRVYLKKDTELAAAILKASKSIFSESKNGFKTVLKYNKENAKQMALNTNEQISKILAKLETLPKTASSTSTGSLEERFDHLSTTMTQNNVSVSKRLESLTESLDGYKDMLQDVLGIEDLDSHDSDDETEEYYEEDLTEETDDLTITAEAEPEPAKTPEPTSDPNKMMGPDDIAALLASMGGSEPEPEPVKTPEPASDPNKMMGPDDIAALLASMGN